MSEEPDWYFQSSVNSTNSTKVICHNHRVHESPGRFDVRFLSGSICSIFRDKEPPLSGHGPAHSEKKIPLSWRRTFLLNGVAIFKNQAYQSFFNLDTGRTISRSPSGVFYKRGVFPSSSSRSLCQRLISDLLRELALLTVSVTSYLLFFPLPATRSAFFIIVRPVQKLDDAVRLFQ